MVRFSERISSAPRYIRLKWLILVVLSVLAVVFGITLIVLALADAFETVILPRTVKRSLRLTNIFFTISGKVYGWIGSMRRCEMRQRLSVSFAPLLVFVLIGFWAVLLILGFALLETGLNTPFRDGADDSFFNRLYFSGTTFFTLGLGDYVPSSGLGKLLAVLEGGTGFGFLALVIGYVPVYYTSFSRREQTILLLDSKAGSEPNGSEILRRYAEAGCLEDLPSLLKDWEQFGAQLLENFLSYPVLAFYRSQHDDQSWLNSLTAVIDACALVICCYPGDDSLARRTRFQAHSTFTMARHLIVDFAYVLGSGPEVPAERLSTAQFRAIVKMVSSQGLPLKDDSATLAKLVEIRKLYEPFVTGLSKRLIMDIPDWIRAENVHDNWETTAWDGTHF